MFKHFPEWLPWLTLPLAALCENACLTAHSTALNITAFFVVVVFNDLIGLNLYFIVSSAHRAKAYGFCFLAIW